MCEYCTLNCGTHWIKALQLLAEGKPFESVGGVEGMEAGLERVAAHLRQEWTLSIRENTNEHGSRVVNCLDHLQTV